LLLFIQLFDDALRFCWGFDYGFGSGLGRRLFCERRFSAQSDGQRRRRSGDDRDRLDWWRLDWHMLYRRRLGRRRSDWGGLDWCRCFRSNCDRREGDWSKGGWSSCDRRRLDWRRSDWIWCEWDWNCPIGDDREGLICILMCQLP
jgi:hypothetical protein